MKVVVAPDSFKGSATASEAASAIAAGWSSVRPDDEIVILPQADGGEGTLEALAIAIPGSRLRSIGPIPGPQGTSVDGVWLSLADGTAVVELATLCGLPLHAPLEPLTASTRPLGVVLDAVVSGGAQRVVVALGGSASTDGGAGALSALGMRLLDANDHELASGELATLVSVDRSALRTPPGGGVQLLTDVTNPLLGPRGAAAVFAPQKGASASDITILERGLTQLASVLGGNPDQPGSGSAGGTAYGLVAAWGATIVDGAATVARLTGLTSVIAEADILITGEGRFDHTSLGGKAVGHALSLSAGGSPRAIIVAGSVEAEPAGASTISLSDLAGSTRAAMESPLMWLEKAGAVAASTV